MRKRWEPVLWGLKRCRDPSHPARLFRAWGKGLWRHHFQTWFQLYCFREMLEGSSSVSLQSPSRKPGLLFFQCIPVYLLSQVGRWLCPFPRSRPSRAAWFCGFYLFRHGHCSAYLTYNLGDERHRLAMSSSLLYDYSWISRLAKRPEVPTFAVCTASGFFGWGAKILVFSSPFHRPGHTACS